MGDVIVHYTDAAVRTGKSIEGALDWKRRKQLMDHHTAVHIVGGAARRLLGPHVFQAGSHLSVESGRLDITHFQRLTRDELDAMEAMANTVLSVRTTENRTTARTPTSFTDLISIRAVLPKETPFEFCKSQTTIRRHAVEPITMNQVKLARFASLFDRCPGRCGTSPHRGR